MEAAESQARSSDNEKMGIDEVLQTYAGEFGRWQMKQFVLASMAWALEAFHTMVMIFADREPEWRCVAGSEGAPCRYGEARSEGLCNLPRGSWEWVGEDAASTVSEWSLICGARYKVGLAQSAFFAGCMVGAGVFGHLSDSFMGRKGVLILVCALNAVFGLLTALSPSFSLYTILRLLTGFSTGGVGLCAFILATEPVGPSKRGLAGMSTFYFFSGGIAILSLLASFVSSWRFLYVITSLPSILFLFIILPFVSESPRWYLVRRKTTHALNVLQEIAKANERELPEGITLTLDDNTQESEPSALSFSIIDVIKLPLTRIRLLLAVLISFFCAVIYYGLSLNVVNLKTNIYLSVFLNSAAEMPAFLLTAIVLDKLGRRPLAVSTMLLSGVFCLMAVVAGEEMKILRLAAAVMGIFCMAGNYNLLFIYTAELFPTTVRNIALGCATQASHLGAILAPMVVVWGEKVPFAVFAACGVAGSLVALFLPETMNKPLYDTLAGMEDGEGDGVESVKRRLVA